MPFASLAGAGARLKGKALGLPEGAIRHLQAKLSPSLRQATARTRTRLLPLLERVHGTAKTRLPVASLVVCMLALVGCGLVGWIYLQGQREGESLRTQLYSARRELRKHGTEASRQERLTDALTALAAAREYFPQTLDSVQTLEDVFLLAEVSGVRVSDVKTRPSKDKKVGRHTYEALSVSLQVEGSLPGLQAFLDALENGSAGAVSLDQLAVSRIQGSPMASLSVSAYARR